MEIERMTRPGLRATGGLAALAVAAVMLALPAMAAATTNTPIAQTGGMTATLPILGGGVAVTVALDQAGNITGVTVGNPALTQSKASSDFVKFATADGKTSVTVKARGSKLAISAGATTLAELVGTGTWSADVFGTGTKSSASYTIGDDGSGNPTVSLDTPAPLPAGATWAAGTPKAFSGKSEHDGASASAGGTFAYQGFEKRLKVSVNVEPAKGSEPGHASLRITLTGHDFQKLGGTLADLAAVGNRTWSAFLCDGTTKVTVSYHVNADGTIGFDSATGAPATQKTGEHGGLQVRFDGTNVGVSIRVKDNGDGTFSLVVMGRSGQCGKGGSDHQGQGHGHHHHGGNATNPGGPNDKSKGNGQGNGNGGGRP